MKDRDLQDRLIRALADSGYRRSDEWLDGGLAEPERLERFARFLARNFYRNRVIHFFKYSRALARVTGRIPEHALDGPGFAAILPRAVLGSRETARAVAALVGEELRAATGSDRVPYHADLLAYQEAMMVAEAGPRDWNGAEDRRVAPEAAAAEVVDGTTVLRLQNDLPSVLTALLAPWRELPEAPRRPIRLLIARSRHGRVSVVILSDHMERALALADGTRSLADLSKEAGGPVSDLLDLGAIRVSTGS
ncbi:MAG: hypothetical protein ACRDH9_08540 [Actinomycetota bacterium]